MYGGYAGSNYNERFISFEGKNISYNDLDNKKIEKIMKYNLGIVNDYITKMKEKYPDETKVCDYDGLFEVLSNNVNNVIENILPELTSKSEQYINFIKNLCFDIHDYSVNTTMNDVRFFIDNYDNYKNDIEFLIGKFENIDYVNLFSNVKNSNIVIIGGNGSGKSSFVSFLKKIYYENMVVMHAQKLLIFDRTISGVVDTRQIDIKNVQTENAIESQRNTYTTINTSYSSTIFSKLVIALANTTIKQQDEYYKNHDDKHETIIDQINDICDGMLNIKFKLNTDKYSIDGVDENGKIYNINSMSDGEKAILFYVGNVLYAAKNSYIVIDEPETHLNPAVYKKLWSRLESERADCQFIYVSHDIEFVRTKKNSKLFWMKKYTHPEKWKIEPLESDNVIPFDLMMEIYGSKTEILFCEGTKESDDYSIYSSVFDNKYTVIPAGSCEDVKKFTISFNAETNIHNNKAIGIIDNDFKSEKTVEDLKRKQVYVAKYNEIEMILFDEKVMMSVLDNFSEEQQKEKINNFKEKFFDHMEKNKERIVLEIIREEINTRLHNKTINSKSIDQITDELTEFINEINYSGLYEDRLTLLQEYIDKKDYNNLIKYCNLKREIIGIANTNLISDYRTQAINVIRKNLKEYIKDKYFEEIDENEES